MSSTPLENLAKIGQLDAVPESPELARNKLISARKRLADSRAAPVSNETRFDAGCNAIRDMAEIGLLMRGFRTTSRPGHHQTAIQCLGHTLGLDDAAIRVIDGLRKQRHLADYEGDPVTDAALAECVRQAAALLPRVEAALVDKGWVT